MRAAHIVDGKVINLIETESLDIWPGVVLVEAPGAVNIGDLWNGEEFVEAPEPPAAPPTA